MSVLSALLELQLTRDVVMPVFAVLQQCAPQHTRNLKLKHGQGLSAGLGFGLTYVLVLPAGAQPVWEKPVPPELMLLAQMSLLVVRC